MAYADGPSIRAISRERTIEDDASWAIANISSRNEIIGMSDAYIERNPKMVAEGSFEDAAISLHNNVEYSKADSYSV